MHVVKRKGHNETFDVKKVYASVYWASRSAHVGEQEAEKLAEAVSKKLNAWIRGKKVVGSKDIFRQVCVELAKRNADAVYMYRTHLDVS